MCVERFYTVFFGSAVFIEVFCGLMATATAAFFRGQTNIWGIIIFAVYSVFSVFSIGMGYLAIKEVRNLEKKSGEPASETLNWLFGMCAIVTIGFIGLIRWLAWPQNEGAKAFIIWPLLIIIIVMILLVYVWVCFTKLFYGFRGRRLDKEEVTCGECCLASWNACGACCI